MSLPIIIYTDGSCLGNPGRGGWGAVILNRNQAQYLSGSHAQTTNNRMEMMAAIQALKSLKIPETIELHTDSKYLKDGITSWLPKWKARSWKKADNKPVKNVDLWQALDEQVNKHNVTWHWVKGHSGNLYNEKADQLARKAITCDTND